MRDNYIETGQPPSARYRRALVAFAVMAAVYFFSYFLRTAIPGTIFNELQTDLGLPATAIATLGSMFIFIYAWMQLFVGMAADRMGGTRTLVFGGVIMGIGATVFPLSQSLWLLYGSRAVTGFGASFMYLSIIKEVDLLFDKRRFPVMTGIALACGYLGGITAMLPFERIVAWCGWRPSLFVIGLLIMACVGIAFLLLRTMDHYTPRNDKVTLRPLWDIIRNAGARPLLVCSFINFPVYFVIQATLGKKFLEDYAGLPSAQAAAFTTVMMTVSAVLAIMGGFAPAWCGERRKPILVAAPVTVLIATLIMLAGVLIGLSSWIFLAAYVLLAIPSGAGPAGIAAMKELNPPERAALSLAVGNGLAYLGIAVFTAIAGVILDAFSQQAAHTAKAVIYPREAYTWIFTWLSFMALVSVISSFGIPETRGRHIGEAGATGDAGV